MRKTPRDETEPPDPGAQADLVEEEAPSPKVCLKHPRPCYHDGPCPACQAEKEFKNLTRGMLFSNRTKPVDKKGGKP